MLKFKRALVKTSFKDRTHLKIQIHKYTYLFGAAFKYDILLTLVQPPLPHCPEVKDSVLSLEQLI